MQQISTPPTTVSKAIVPPSRQDKKNATPLHLTPGPKKNNKKNQTEKLSNKNLHFHRNNDTDRKDTASLSSSLSLSQQKRNQEEIAKGDDKKEEEKTNRVIAIRPRSTSKGAESARSYLYSCCNRKVSRFLDF